MRPVPVVSLIFLVAFSGCIGGSFDETSSEDLFGNQFAVFQTEGKLPRDGSKNDGASAKDLLLHAEIQATDWASDARLRWVAGVELAPDASIGIQQYAGPMPSYQVHDGNLGDGLAPAWSYLFVAPSKATSDICEYLFVHVAYNGFVVSYTFDPDAEMEGSEFVEDWGCGPHAAIDSTPRWTVDSDQMAGTFNQQSVYTDATATAQAVFWGLDVAADADPEDELQYDTRWVTGVSQDTALTASPEDFVVCFAPATSSPGESGCFSFGDFMALASGGDEELPAATPRLEPESGLDTVPYGYVFSGSQVQTFTIANEGHPSLAVNFEIGGDVSVNTYTIELLDGNGTVAATHNGTMTSAGESGTLTADAPEAGQWTLRVAGSTGKPEVDFSWCATGYDYDSESAIDCA